MKNKGITLIALVIMIIILLILASVGIAVLTGDNGLINKATEAKVETEQAEMEEQLRLAQMSAKIKREGRSITIQDILEELDKQGVDYEKEDDTIIIDGKHVFEVEEKNGGVSWESQGTTSKPKPKIASLEIIDKTETTIKIRVSVVRNGKGTLLYSIQEKNGSYKEISRSQTISDAQIQEEYTYMIDPEKSYSKIKVEAIAENGETTSKEIDIVTIPELTIKDVTFGYTVEGKEIKETDYTQGPVVVTVQVNAKNIDMTGLTIQYATTNPEVESNWKEYQTGVEFTKNGSIYVRLAKGKEGGKYAIGSVRNIDKLKPKQFTPTITSKIDSITISGVTTDQEATQTDGCSGIDKYYFSKDNGVTWEPTGGMTAPQGGNQVSYTFSELMPDNNFTLQIKATDKAGNEIITEAVEEKTTKLEVGFDYPTTFTKENLTVKVTTVPQNLTESGYIIQYSKDGITWESYQTAGISMTENGSLQARVKNAKGKVLGNATTNIGNIDKIEPNEATIEVNKIETWEEQTITAKVAQSDNTNGSGVNITNCKWMVTTSATALGTDETNYTNGSFTTNPQTITLNCPNKGVSYFLHVLTIDKVGNKKETISEAIRVKEIVNEPNLEEGMTAVYWDASNTEKTLTENSSPAEWDKWYEYKAGDNAIDTKDSQWANAKITKNGVDSYFVWIPRFEYKIASGEGTSTTGKIEVKFIPTDYELTEQEKTDGWKIHPAFQDGTSNHFKNGEWDSELSGIWVGKYETSHSDATKTSEGSENTVQIKPEVRSWRNITIGDCYQTVMNYDTQKGSHLMKNSEWGAVAYLTHSQYGRNGHEIDINNSNTYITGNGGGSTNASPTVGTANAYNSEKGAQASTTGNIYGIYDLSGGAWEYVASYISNGNSYLSNGNAFALTTTNANGYQNQSTKYATVYPYDSSNDNNTNNYTTYKGLKYGKGDAILETSAVGENSTSWFSDYSNFPYTFYPFFVRGGDDNNGASPGAFAFSSSVGHANSYYSFRVVLASI